ncbi:hypothetical protein B0H17DRAFT_1049937 [Mycena rosella]|uniref:Uncharacterized protein n=1 Tax=Mycena rosella TaxID=1033263 RepID=A0AAD7GKJ1_MYCRO|nr:hypothetical protein B0H17DRAFT_1049937 [Mycena rosella]
MIQPKRQHDSRSRSPPPGNAPYAPDDRRATLTPYREPYTTTRAFAGAPGRAACGAVARCLPSGCRL